MTYDTEISKSLALALDWKISHVVGGNGDVHVCICRGLSRKFDYQAPDVVLALLEWLLREHGACLSYGIEFLNGSFTIDLPDNEITGATIAEVVARAVIEVKK